MSLILVRPSQGPVSDRSALRHLAHSPPHGGLHQGRGALCGLLHLGRVQRCHQGWPNEKGTRERRGGGRGRLLRAHLLRRHRCRFTRVSFADHLLQPGHAGHPPLHLHGHRRSVLQLFEHLLRLQGLPGGQQGQPGCPAALGAVTRRRRLRPDAPPSCGGSEGACG